MNASVEHRESPGTITLVDVAGTMQTQHSKAEKDIVLNPTPSADPNDPLNWSAWRKWRTTLCSLLFTWCICCSSSACFSVFLPIYEESGISLDHLNQGTGYMYLFFGWGLLLWQPLALTFGRRGVFLLCLVGTCLMNVWAGYAKTNGTWIASRILIGFFGAPCEALVEVVMADLWFTHQRGTYMGLYVMALYGGQMASVPSGFISNAQGWPWVLWWCAILNAFGFVVCFFFLEETLYHRELLPVTEASSGVPVVHEKMASFTVAADGSNTETDSKGMPEAVSPTTGSITGPTTGMSYPVRSYAQKLLPFVPLNGRSNTFWQQAYKPLLLVRFPGIVFGGFIYGCYLNWYAMVNATVSVYLTSPPYNWSAANIGLSYIAELIGTYASGFVAGRLADRLSLYLAKRNNGVMEPEFRLWIFSLLAILAPAGLFLYGIGYAHGLNQWALLVGMGFIGFVGPACGSLTVSYIVDCYRDISGEALITVILIRNTLNFAFNYGVTPWVNNQGAQNSFMAAGLIAFATTLLFLVMVYWGKSMRKATAPAYWEFVEAMH